MRSMLIHRTDLIASQDNAVYSDVDAALGKDRDVTRSIAVPTPKVCDADQRQDDVSNTRWPLPSVVPTVLRSGSVLPQDVLLIGSQTN